ncbi:MAG TPA: hypothetical protein DD727_07250, partial [Clostridiales bacterium]|nr:hypothetical protein [Clostridiales bacterium]
WREELGLAPDTDIYNYYDLDWIVTVPNLDPHIKQFEVLRETEEEVVVRTGFEAILRKKLKDPMPEYVSFETNTLEKMEAFRFDDPWDDRRYFSGGDNQLAGVGDGFTRNLPPWMETVLSLRPDIPVYGSVAEAHETLWRIIGSNNVLLWVGLYPDELSAFIERVSAYVVELTKAQIRAASGKLDGMVVWGDVAYTKDMLFSPDFWREHFKPCLAEIVKVCHDNGLPVIYHGCGNVKKIFPDYIETGIDAYNPLEAKAGLDVVDLRRQYGHRLGFCGNMDVLTWANADMDTLKAEALRKLNAAKGGGLIFQSDHSVPDSISGERYDQVVQWVREYGKYPLKLGQYDIDMTKQDG